MRGGPLSTLARVASEQLHEAEALGLAERQYGDALAGILQPQWPDDHAPADPYGRTLALVDGDFQVGRGAQGQRDLAIVAGKMELAQALQVLVGTAQASDIFNVLFGFDLERTLMQPRGVRESRELIRLCVVKALAQEPRIRQVLAVAFVSDPDYLRLHPSTTPEEQAALAREQRVSRRWTLDVLLDTSLGEQVAAVVAGTGP